MAAPEPAAAKRRLIIVGVPLIVVGLALIAIGIYSGQIVVPVRIVVGLVGWAALHNGASRIGHRLFGQTFDLTLWLCGLWLAVILLLALVAPLLTLPEYQDVSKTLTEPIYAPIGTAGHPLGTNAVGLDLYSRVIYGARASLTVAIAAIVIGMVLGGVVGLIAGYFRRVTDRVVGVLTTAVLAVPPLILLIALGTVLDPSIRNIAIALSLLTIPGIVRLSRANTMAFAQREFVTAAEAIGASRWRIMMRELLPNVVLPLLSMAMIYISVLIVAEASLSFLGLGIKPPAPTWGNMIAEGDSGIFLEHPTLVVVPGVVLFLTVFSFNFVGEAARRRWDPRSAKL